MKVGVKVPHKRVKSINSAIKKIKSKLQIKIQMRKNEAIIEGKSYQCWLAKQVCKAIGRGFSPEKALELAEGKELEIISLRDFTQKSRKRLKARIIGSEGRAKKKIEKMSGADIKVQGKTVALLGNRRSLDKAKKAVGMLLEGAKHSSVYRFLENKCQKLLKS